MNFFRPLIYSKGDKWFINSRKFKKILNACNITNQEEMKDYLLGFLSSDREFVNYFLSKSGGDNDYSENFDFYYINDELIVFNIKMSDLKKKIGFKVSSRNCVNMDKFSFNDEIFNKILSEVPDNFSLLQKSYYIYKRLCQIFSYDEEYYVFLCDNSRCTVDHFDIDRLSYIEENGDLVCYEFCAIYAYFLNKLGIPYNLIDYKGDVVVFYGGFHAQVKFKADDYIVNADSSTGIHGSDMALEKSFGIINNFSILPISLGNSNDFEKELREVDLYFKNNKINGDLEQCKYIYEQVKHLFNNNELSNQDKFDLLIWSIVKNNMKFVDIFRWILFVANKIFENNDCCNYRVELIVNNNPINKKNAELSILIVYSLNDFSSRDSFESNYVIIDSNRNVSSYNIRDFKGLLRSKEYRLFSNSSFENLEDIDEIIRKKKLY